MLSVTLMCGNSSKCWKTMPICARSRVRLVFGSPTEMPLTTTSPCWKGSRPLTVLISVLLPEPDGPHTTTTSPLFTAVEQPFRTCTAPSPLLTFFISITGMRASPELRESSAGHGQPGLEPLHEARKPQTYRERNQPEQKKHATPLPAP